MEVPVKAAFGETPPGGETIIEVRDLRMTYGTTEVLRGVNFTVRRGEVLALLGPNGAGKTTTIEILEGFRLPSAGAARVLGIEPAAGDEAWRARLGVVLQSWRDHGRWKVRDLLAHFGEYYIPFSRPGREPRDPDQLIELVGLTEHAAKKIASLSGGQRRRLDVAIGIIGRPELLFLDEPTARFDPAARTAFHAMVQSLAKLEDTTILLTTHDLAEAEKLASRILILAGGRIVADGSAAELSRQVSGQTEISWTRDGKAYRHSAADATRYVRELFAQHGDAIADLEVRRTTLENTYLAIVRQHEAAKDRPAAADGFTGVAA